MATDSGDKGLDTKFTAFKVPLRVVIKWPPSNYTNPERRRWFIPYSITLFTLTTLVVAARLWTRMNKKAGGYGWDDSLILAAWVTASGIIGLGIYGVHTAGLDRHVWDLRPEECVRSGLMAWSTEMLFLTSLCFTKVSVLLFFRRLVDRSHSPWISKSIWGAIAFTVTYFLAFLFFLIFACDPVYATWRSLDITWTGKYQCADRSIVDPLNGIVSVLSDAYSIIIPVLVVRRLSMPTSRKVVLYLVFCCGLIVLGAGIARTVWLARLYTDARRDQTWVGHDLLVWGTLEVQMALVCACAPAMKGFLSGFSRTVIHRCGSKSRETDRSNGYPFASNKSIPLSGSGDGESNFMRRYGQSVTLHEALRGDEQLRTHDPNFWKWCPRDTKSLEVEVKYVEEPYYRGNWAEPDVHSQSDATWTGVTESKTSDEMLMSLGKTARVQDGGILVTETFTVERGTDPYAKERRALGI